MNAKQESSPTHTAHSATRDGPHRLGGKVLSKLSRARLAVAAGLGIAGMTGLALASIGQASAATTTQWSMTAGNIQQLSQQDPGTASHFYNTSSSFGTGASLVKTPVQRGYATTPVLDYTSYAQVASDIANGAITYSYKWVMYDPENWSATPVNGAQAPKTYMRKFGQLAHANGMKAIMAPSRNLSSVTGTLYPQLKGETSDQWYIRVGIASTGAAYGDTVLVQDEYNESNVPEFAWLYNTAAAQARSASPGVKVFSEVSTDFGTTSQMVAAAKSVTADGFFVAAAGNIPQTDQFFQQMQTAGY